MTKHRNIAVVSCWRAVRLIAAMPVLLEAFVLADPVLADSASSDRSAVQATSQGELAEKAPASSSANAAEQIDEIVITAQRRAQNLEDVPIAVTSISAETIKDFNIQSLDRVSILTPDLVFDVGYGIAQTYIRGIGATNVFGIGLESPVATYVDGAYFARGLGAVFDLLDVSSVEVLKGPQGTLYGRNASGGAILVNTENPTNVQASSMTLEYGNFGHVKVDGMANLPISDTLSLRFAARYRNDDGFVKDITTGQWVRGKTSEAVRAKLQWKPTSDFVAVLSVDYNHETSISEAAGRQEAVAPICVACGPPFNGAYQTTGFYQTTEDYARQDGLHGENVNLNLQYDAGPLKFTSISAYRYLNGTISDDPDHTSFPLYATNVDYGGRTVSEDLQVASSFDGIINFLAGGQYIHDDAFETAHLFGALFGLPYVNQIDGTGIPPVNVIGGQDVITKSYASFAEVYIKPVESLTITLGGRYSKDIRDISTNLNPLGLAYLNPGGQATFSQSASYQKFTPRGVIAYDLGLVNLYTSFTRGFKAGGFASPAFSPQGTPINPETIDSYEVGAKFVSPDKRTRMNLAVFDYLYKDVQVSTIDYLHNTQIVTNAAKARGKGVEFDLSTRPIPWLSLGAGASYLDAKYTSYPNGSVFELVRNGAGSVTGVAVGTTDLSGTALPRAPEWSGFVTADLQTHLTDGWLGHLNTIVHSSSPYFFTAGAGGPLRTDVQHAVTLVGGSVGISPESRKYEVSVYGDNLTNQEYYTTRVIGAFGVDALAAMPRTFGVRLTANF